MNEYIGKNTLVRDCPYTGGLCIGYFPCYLCEEELWARWKHEFTEEDDE